MIIKFKIFESEYFRTDLLDKYVLIKPKFSNFNLNGKEHIFFENNIGKIVRVSHDVVLVKYDNIPENIKSYFKKDGTRLFDIDRIVISGDTEEDVRIKMETEKFNL